MTNPDDFGTIGANQVSGTPVSHNQELQEHYKRISQMQSLKKKINSLDNQVAKDLLQKIKQNENNDSITSVLDIYKGLPSQVILEFLAETHPAKINKIIDEAQNNNNSHATGSPRLIGPSYHGPKGPQAYRRPYQSGLGSQYDQPYYQPYYPLGFDEFPRVYPHHQALGSQAYPLSQPYQSRLGSQYYQLSYPLEFHAKEYQLPSYWQQKAPDKYVSWQGPSSGVYQGQSYLNYIQPRQRDFFPYASAPSAYNQMAYDKMAYVPMAYVQRGVLVDDSVDFQRKDAVNNSGGVPTAVVIDDRFVTSHELKSKYYKNTNNEIGENNCCITQLASRFFNRLKEIFKLVRSMSGSENIPSAVFNPTSVTPLSKSVHERV